MQPNEICAQWQSRLGLLEWTIDLDICDIEEAEISWHEDYHDATLKLTKDWAAWTDKRLEQTIVHELLHLLLRELHFLAQGKPDFPIYEHHEEAVVERLAKAFVGSA